MIARLTGHITDEALDHFVVDVNGVGYLVHCPIGTAQRAKRLEDGRSTLIIHTVVREDAFLLYGFANQTEREIFLKIIAISGVGPKLASAILSDMDVNEILQTVQSENVQRLTKVSGVGKKTAQRLILELKGSLQNWAPEDNVAPKPKAAASRLEDDLKSALLNLGYKPLLVDDVVDKLSPIPEDMNSIEPLIRQALKLLQ
ncbi:Holliday junction branch migration protein RuvA [Microvenator marinus]|uniref:Holliday junction branch migration complex subunit RuvA n=1 Tax=Microvenator marinus TaxID=2600177 RepID=A0A5B8XS30_9DELT|nr:Holliday junction branch migration protein RuvA [Microvenator marinus]QED26209.1 Holliday junction branch migration protein RuvA [Microvenator marinus]